MIYGYVGSGILLKNSVAGNNKSFSYSDSSILEFTTENLGSVVDISTVSEDYGDFSPASQSEDYNSIIDTETLYPFGGLTLSGSALTQPNYRLFISGSAVEKIIYSPDDTSGTLFGFGEKLESVTYDYNESSEETTELDYGLISQISIQSDDYESITSSSLRQFQQSYGLITESTSEILTPFGGLTLSGSALTQPNYRLFISGSAVEKIIYSPDDTSGTLFGFGEKLESVTYDYNDESIYENTDDYGLVSTTYSQTKDYGLISETGGTQPEDNYGLIIDTILSSTISPFGSLFLSGVGLESFSEVPFPSSGLFIISGIGTAIKLNIESYVGLGTLTLSGTVLESDTESYVGLGTLTLSGTVLESDTESYVGLGTLTLSDSGIESQTILIPAVGIGTGFIGGTISIFNTVTRYYSPVYPRNSEVPGSGIGTIQINDDNELTFYRVTLPYEGTGVTNLTGIGNESFTPSTHVASGVINLLGSSLTKKVALYQDYVTSGGVTISQQTSPIIEKNTESYIGSGQLTISETIDFRETNVYNGSGSFNLVSTADESFTIDLPETTVDIVVSGSGESKFVAQTPENTQLFTISGNATDITVTHTETGIGQLTFDGAARLIVELNVFGTGGFRFVSKEYTFDGEDDGVSSLTISVEPNTIELSLFGSAITSQQDLQIYSSVGLFNINSEISNLKSIKNYDAFGNLFTISRSVESHTEAYVGFGTAFISSSASESSIVIPEKSTAIITISESGFTKIDREFVYSGIGDISLFGSAGNQILVHNEIGSGIITLYGEVSEPEWVRFIPSPDGSGTINIIGISNNSLIKKYDQTFGTLFALSSGFESFGRQTYVGLGTIYIQEISGLTINNPYQIPRVYVTII